MNPSRIQTASGTLNRQCAKATAICVSNKPDRAVKLKERQGKYRRRGHPVGEQPEEQMLVTKERIAAESIGGRQRDSHEMTVFITT